MFNLIDKTSWIFIENLMPKPCSSTISLGSAFLSLAIDEPYEWKNKTLANGCVNLFLSVSILLYLYISIIYT